MKPLGQQGASLSSGLGFPSGIVVDSYGLVQSCQMVSWNVPRVIGIGFCTEVHGSKWPISNCVEMLVSSAAHGMMLAFLAVEYSGW